MKWMLLLSVLLSAALLPMQGQKQGSDYVLHIRHLDAAGTGQVKNYTYYDGLGRPYETVKRGYTPTGKDLVQSNELDAKEVTPLRGKTLYRATSWTLRAASTRRYCR